MKKVILLLAVVAACVFGMQKPLKDIKDQIKTWRDMGASEEDLADLKRQEAELEAQAGAGASQGDFVSRFARWRQLAAPTTEEQVIEKSQLEYELLDDLAKQSKSRWFYTGDLIDKVLEIKGTPVENQPPFGLIIQVPREVRRDLSNPLVYLVSFQQIENTCGFHALANAYAITQQVTEKKPITYEGTREIAQQIFKSKIQSDPSFKALTCATSFTEPEYSDLLSVIARLGLRSHFDPDPNFFLIDNTNINDRSVQPMQAQQIRFNPVTNFMYRTPGHFLILSVVNKDDNYTMFALDSMNSPLAVDGQNAKLIAHIDKLIQMAKAIDISSGASAAFEQEQESKRHEAENKKRKTEASSFGQGSSQSSNEPLDQSEIKDRIVRQFNNELAENPTIKPYQDITEIWDGIRDKTRRYLGMFGSDKKLSNIQTIAEGLGSVPTVEGKKAIKNDEYAHNYYRKLRDYEVTKANTLIEEESYKRAIELLRPFTPDTSAKIIKTYIKMITYLAQQSKRSAREQAGEALEYVKTLEREIKLFGDITPQFKEQKVELEKLYDSLK